MYLLRFFWIKCVIIVCMVHLTLAANGPKSNSNNNVTNLGVTNEYDPISLIGTIIGIASKLHHLLDQITGTDDSTKIVNAFNPIHYELDQLINQQIFETNGINSLYDMIQKLPEKILLELNLEQLSIKLDKINIVYEQSKAYLNHTNTFENSTLDDFAQSIVSEELCSIRKLLEAIQLEIFASDGISTRGLLQRIIENVNNIDSNYGIFYIEQSPQQILYTLYTNLIVTNLKGYTLIQFAYVIKYLRGQGNFTAEQRNAHRLYEKRFENFTLIFQKQMARISRDLWRPDPDKHLFNQTYVQLTGYREGFLVNEVDLNDEQTCKYSCSDYQEATVHSCFNNLYCNRQRKCNGKVYNCQFFESDLNVCPATDQSSGTGRRYQYIEGQKTGKTYGIKGSCKNSVVDVKSWWRWLFWHCSYCLCLCDEIGPDFVRYFSLQQSVADVARNRVMVGLRFVQINNVIHIQIQQGELLAGGIINQSTVQWIPIKPYRISDTNIRPGRDYHMIRSNGASIDLDNVEVQKNHLATGVRFRVIGGHLHLQIYASPFNFTTGKLEKPLNRSLFVDRITDISNRTKLDLVHLLVPKGPSRPDSRTGQYVDFTSTDLKWDLAQSIVPFVDIQPVKSKVPIPLSGAGIYHKTDYMSGGYIALKTITYDFSQHIFLP